MEDATNSSQSRRVTTSLVVLLLVSAAGLAFYLIESGHIAAGKALCAACNRPLHKAQVYKVISRSGATALACCPRCGLRYAIENEAQSAQATDFKTGKPIPADSAFYLEGSAVMECCSSTPVRTEAAGLCDLHYDRCLPSLVAFSKIDDAEEYRRLQGGRIIDLAGARLSVARQIGR
jgi:hypothetical protein